MAQEHISNSSRGKTGTLDKVAELVGAGGTEEWALTAPAAIETTASTRRWRNLLDNIGIGGPRTCVKSEINEAERSRKNLLLPSAPAPAMQWFFFPTSS